MECLLFPNINARVSYIIKNVVGRGEVLFSQQPHGMSSSAGAAP